MIVTKTLWLKQSHPHSPCHCVLAWSPVDVHPNTSDSAASIRSKIRQSSSLAMIVYHSYINLLVLLACKLIANLQILFRLYFIFRYVKQRSRYCEGLSNSILNNRPMHTNTLLLLSPSFCIKQKKTNLASCFNGLAQGPSRWLTMEHMGQELVLGRVHDKCTQSKQNTRCQQYLLCLASNISLECQMS